MICQLNFIAMVNAKDAVKVYNHTYKFNGIFFLLPEFTVSYDACNNLQLVMVVHMHA